MAIQWYLALDFIGESFEKYQKELILCDLELNYQTKAFSFSRQNTFLGERSALSQHHLKKSELVNLSAENTSLSTKTKRAG